MGEMGAHSATAVRARMAGCRAMGRLRSSFKSAGVTAYRAVYRCYRQAGEELISAVSERENTFSYFDF